MSNHITNTNILDLVYLRLPLVGYWSTLLAKTVEMLTDISTDA